MKNTNNNMTSFIITAGVVVLIIFTGVVYFNMIPGKESASYYVSIQDDLSDKIKSFDITGNELNIITKIDNIEYCVKTTKSTPDDKNLCWNKIKDNKGTMKIMLHRTYYVWIKDEGGNISDYLTINSDTDDIYEED